MEISEFGENYQDKIVSYFKEMKNVEDFSYLLTFAQFIYYGEKEGFISAEMLYYLSNPKYNPNRYHQFSIRKKSGGERIINSPCSKLKNVLRILNFLLQQVLEPHNAATGFVPGKSIVDNAKKHVGRNYVYNIDLKDFFHSFDKNRVKVGLIRALKKNVIHIEEKIAYLIACLSTHPLEINGEEKCVLPQGSPVSPTLTNILCQQLDRRLTGLARRFDVNYSRYADDITFSSDHNVYNNDDFLNELHRIITSDNKLEFKKKTVILGPELTINDKKTRLQKKHGYRQEVTGIIVNEKVNVARRYVKTIRTWLYQWERYGYKKANDNFAKDHAKDKGITKQGKFNLVNVLEGKLEYLKMVKGESDSTYQKLKDRFDKLNKFNKIDKLLNIWEKKDIEEAIKFQEKSEKDRMAKKIGFSF